MSITARRSVTWRRWLGVPLGLLIAALATLPMFSSAYSVVLVTSIFMYIVLTLSWALFSGPTGYVSLASAAFFGIGIYSSAILGKSMPVAGLVIVGGLASAVLAVIVGALTLRLRGVYFAIFTFGLVELIKHLLLWYEIEFTGTRGRFVVLVANQTIYFVMLGILVLLVVVAYLIRQSRWGLALRSIGQNEEAATHAGVNVTLAKVATFGVSAFFAGAAGAIMATRWTYVDPYIAFNPLFSFMPVLMAIFGGTGQLYGPIIGAAVFTYLEEILITRFAYWYMLIFGTILVVAILYLPNGIVGLVPKLGRWRWRRRATA